MLLRPSLFVRDWLRKRTAAALISIAVVAYALTPAAGAEDVTGQFQADLAALTAVSSRVVGSDGYSQAVQYVERAARALGNVEIRRHDYPVMVPVTLPVLPT